MSNVKKTIFMRIQAIYDHISKTTMLRENVKGKPDIELLRDILNFLLKPETARIIYSIYKVKIASSYELSHLSSINYGSFMQYIGRLERYGIIFAKNRDTEDYEEYLTKWRLISPRASNRTIVCVYNPDFMKIAGLFEDIVKSSFNYVQFEKVKEREKILRTECQV